MRNGIIAAGAVVVAAATLTAGCGAGRLPGPIPAKDGTYTIGNGALDDVAPGNYRTYSDKCKWKIEGDRPRSGSGPGTVQLDGGRDIKITVRGCGTWVEVRG